MSNEKSLDAIFGKQRLILGTWGLGGPHQIGGRPFGWPALESKTAVDVVQSALDSGITAFDTSDFYGQGRSEALLGQVIGHRSDVIIATKGGLLNGLTDTGDLQRNFTSDYLEKAVNASLRRLRRDTIDIYQLHGPPATLIHSPEPWEMLERLKTSGKIRHAGVSLSTSGRDRDLNGWLSKAHVDFVQIPYSIAEPRALKQVDDVAMANNYQKVLLGRSVLQHGLLLHGTLKSSRVVGDHRATKWSPELDLFAVHLPKLLPPGVTLVQALLAVALCGPSIQRVVVGATRPEQVAQLASTYEAIADLSDVRAQLIQAALTAFAANEH